jgi:hypothetical protein
MSFIRRSVDCQRRPQLDRSTRQAKRAACWSGANVLVCEHSMATMPLWDANAAGFKIGTQNFGTGFDRRTGSARFAANQKPPRANCSFRTLRKRNAHSGYFSQMTMG